MTVATVWLLAAIATAPTPSPSWGRACAGVSDFWPDACAQRFNNAYERGLCKAAQEQSRRASHVVVENVRRTVVYNARMQRFEVQIPGVMTRDIGLQDCAEGECISRVLVARAMTWPSRSGGLRTLLSTMARGKSAMDNPVTRFYVPLMDVGEPRTFERRLRVDVMFKILRSPSTKGDANLVAHALVGPPVGIRATLQDGIWAREIRKPPGNVRCLRPAGLGKRTTAEAGPTTARRKGQASDRPLGKKPKKTSTENPTRRLSREQITATIDHHGAAIRVCYNKELGRRPDLAGGLTFQFTIVATGRTQKVRETQRTLPSQAVSDCVRGILETMVFPRFEGKPLTIVYPFAFGDG